MKGSVTDMNGIFKAPLAASFPLGGDRPFRETIGPLDLAEKTDFAIVSLAVGKQAGRYSPLGFELPGPGKWSGSQDMIALWTGPEQWLVMAEGKAGSGFCEAMVRIQTRR